MSRRGKGEGTVGREGDGWVARIELPPGTDGKRRRIRRRAKTKTQAIAILRKLRVELAEVDNPDGLRRTVAVAVETYVASQPRAKRSRKTIEMEQWRASVIVAGLGGQEIGKLSVADCDAFLEAAASGEFGRRSIGTESLNRIRRLLIRSLDNERRLGNLVRNVAELARMPVIASTYDDVDEDGEVADGLRRSLTREELSLLWHTARMPLLVVVDLCSRNGLRPSEARALGWSSVDLDELTIRIERQLSSSDRITRVKTARSRRTIRIDEVTALTLRRWRAIQDGKRVRAGDEWDPDGLALVVATRYGTPINRHNLARMVRTASEEAGVTPAIVPYELRHTAISHQRHAGGDVSDVADWAGTSERMVNEIYRHQLRPVADLRPVQIDGLGDSDPSSGPNWGPIDEATE